MVHFAVLSKFIQKNCMLLFFVSFFNHFEFELLSTLVRSLLVKSRKSLARDVFDTVVTYAGQEFMTSPTDYWEQNSSTKGRVSATFKRRFFNKQDQK